VGDRARARAKERCLALFATHYFELTALPAEIDGCANLHFDAVEHADGIVFLHAAEDGPANRSYGLQVAKLAACRPPAIRRARDLPRAPRQVQRVGGPQRDLFAPIGVAEASARRRRRSHGGREHRAQRSRRSTRTR
jgi:DNA mismatch repair protein MutS